MQNDKNFPEQADAYARNVSPYFNLEDYKYYVPTGVDELKKEFIETIKEENWS